MIPVKGGSVRVRPSDLSTPCLPEDSKRGEGIDETITSSFSRKTLICAARWLGRDAEERYYFTSLPSRGQPRVEWKKKIPTSLTDTGKSVQQSSEGNRAHKDSTGTKAACNCAFLRSPNVNGRGGKKHSPRGSVIFMMHLQPGRSSSGKSYPN